MFLGTYHADGPNEWKTGVSTGLRMPSRLLHVDLSPWKVRYHSSYLPSSSGDPKAMSAVAQAVILSVFDPRKCGIYSFTHLVVQDFANSIAFVQEPGKPSYKQYHQCCEHRMLSRKDEHHVYTSFVICDPRSKAVSSPDGWPAKCQEMSSRSYRTARVFR